MTDIAKRADEAVMELLGDSVNPYKSSSSLAQQLEAWYEIPNNPDSYNAEIRRALARLRRAGKIVSLRNVGPFNDSMHRLADLDPSLFERRNGKLLRRY